MNKNLLKSISESNINNLDPDLYLVPRLTHFFISVSDRERFENRFLPNSFEKGVHLVFFRSLNLEDRVVIYNYISYPKSLLNSILCNLLLRNYVNNMTINEWGNYCVFIDSNYVTKPDTCTDTTFKPRFIDDHLKETSRYINGINNGLGVNTLGVFESEINKIIPTSNLNTYLNLINKLMFICDINSMANAIDFGFNHRLLEYARLVLTNSNTPSMDEKSFKIRKDFSVLNSTLFVVEELNPLLDNIRQLGYSVNQGPQKWRGQINSMTSFLGLLDQDYRNNLYNHYKHHSTNLSPSTYSPLERRHFNFNNIHKRIGNVRWLSTSSVMSNRQKFFDDSYIKIKNILEAKKNTDLKLVQKSIEEFLLSQESLYFNESDAKNIINFSSENYEFMQEKLVSLNKIMSDWSDKGSNRNIKINSEVYKPWIGKFVEELGVNNISKLLLGLFMYLLSEENGIVDDKHTPGRPTTEVYNIFGKKLVNAYIVSKYIKQGKKLNISLSEYKDKFKSEFEDFYIDNFYARVAGYFVWNLNTVGIIYEEIDSKVSNLKEDQLYIRINQSVRKKFIVNGYKRFHIPLKLPMICEPNPYKYEFEKKSCILGGYLLNDVSYTDDIFIEKIGYEKKTVLSSKNSIINLINGLSSTPYKINVNTLNYIYRHGIEKNIVIDPTKQEYVKFIDNPYTKRTKRDSQKLRGILSKIVMERNILSIAETYSDMKNIYFPIRSDFRTRIYCITDYFDYQKSDLAKGLISFSKPGYIYRHNIEAINFFKAFGANMYGDGLDKKSLNTRVKWIDDNTDRILDFESNDIVDMAENKACFVSFCFEYKRFIDYINDKNKVYFDTYLPIQLDASCNGYQHLVLLTKEIPLLNKLNLSNSEYDDKPDDFYAYILIKVEELLTKKLEFYSKLDELTEKEQSNYDSLLVIYKLNPDRSLVKKAIMTKSYNATIPKQVELILENTDLHLEGNKAYYSYKNGIKFRREDVVIFVMLIKEVLDNESPRINELSKYLESIAVICTKLNIPIPWTLPSGVEIKASYNVEKKSKIKAFSFVNSRYTFKKYIKNEYDLVQQKRALMPNFIHSLDAVSISLLYEELKGCIPIYTVHDCFAVTADNVPMLMSKLKLVYMKLYSDTGYLIKFDELLKINLNSSLGDSVYRLGSDFINIPTDKGSKKIRYPFPNVKNILKPNSNDSVESLKHSKYILI